MAYRRVTHARDGIITAIGNPGQFWSPRAKADTIRDIETRMRTYYVQWPEQRTKTRVVNAAAGKYLRTDRDNTTRNNLDDLPDL